MGDAGPDGLLRPARPWSIWRIFAGYLHIDATRYGFRDGAAGDRAGWFGGAGRPFDGRHDGAGPRPAIPPPLRQTDCCSRADFVCGRRSNEITAWRDLTEPGIGGRPVYCTVGA